MSGIGYMLGSNTHVSNMALRGATGVSGSSAWTPADITTALWLDANDATTITEATGVSQWDDKSGNNRHVTQGTGTRQPTYANSTLSFDGGDELAGTFTLAQPNTFFMVGSLANTNGPQTFFDGLGTFQRWGITGTDVWRYQAGGAAQEGSLSDTALHQFAVSFNGASSYANIDGTEDISGDSGSEGLTNLRIGTNKIASNYLTGDIQEFIILNSAPDTDTRQKIEGYLAWKWDTINGDNNLKSQLPDAHPYKYDGTEFGYGTYSALSLDDYAPYVARWEQIHASRHAISANNAVIKTVAETPIGTTSAVFLDISNPSNLNIDDADDFALPADLGIGGYGMLDSLPSSGTVRRMFQQRAGSNDQHYWDIFNSGGTYTVRYRVEIGGTVVVSMDGSISAPTTGVWYFGGVTRSGNTWKLFWGLASEGTGTVVDTITDSDPVGNITAPFNIGNAPTGLSNSWDGYICGFSISKGFAPDWETAIPSAKIEDDQYKVLIVNGDGNDNSTLIFDEATPDVGGVAFGMRDVSGNFNHMASNGNPTINADGTIALDGTDWFDIDSLVQAQPFTVHQLVRVTKPSAVSAILAGDSNAYMDMDTDGNVNANAGTAMATPADYSGSFKVISVEFNGALSNIRINGVTVQSGAIGSGALAAFGWGARNDGTTPLIGDVSVCLIKSGAYDADVDSAILQYRW